MTASRRSFILGLSLAFTTMPATLASAAPLHPADRAFIAWIGATSVYNRSEADPPAGEPNPLWEAVVEAEKEFYLLPASSMAWAGSVLVEYGYLGHRDGLPIELSEIDPMDERHQCFRALECLRPHLTGIISRVAADLLDNPDRPVGESLLWRLRNGEVPA